MTSERFAEELVRVGEMLAERPVTAREITLALKCSKPTAYARLEALKRFARGMDPRHKLAISWKREGKKGPLSKAYQLVQA